MQMPKDLFCSILVQIEVNIPSLKNNIINLKIRGNLL